MDKNGQKIDKNLQLSNKVIRISQNLFTNITQPMYLCKELSTINYCPIIVKRQKYKMSIFVQIYMGFSNWTKNSWTKMDINGQKWTLNSKIII